MDPRIPHSPRKLLGLSLAALAVAALAVGVRVLLLDDEPPESKTRGARVVEGYAVASGLLGRELPVTVVVPRGARDGKRSLLVFLHSRDGDERSNLNDAMFAALARQGGKAPVVAFPGGDPDAYWHDREQGPWGSVVSEDLVPALIERFEIEPERVAIGGISMGGFGALDIAGRSPELFCSVGAHSPAIWTDADDTAPGAFDDEQDFTEHNVIELLGPPASPLAGKPVWIDVGAEDPFAEATATLVSALQAAGADVRSERWPGAHENSYWDEHWNDYARFYARTLKDCQRRSEQSDSAEDAGGRASPDREGRTPTPAEGRATD